MNRAYSHSHSSPAWLLVGWTRTVPGTLAWRNGHLRFSSSDLSFDVTADEIQSVNFPWYYFGGGLKITARGKRYRLSFVPPNGAEHALARGAAEAGDPAALLGAVAKLRDVREGRRVGRAWRSTLERAFPVT